MDHEDDEMEFMFEETAAARPGAKQPHRFTADEYGVHCPVF